jgi:ATP-dependent Clp protease ATP-binding subunit ClpA
MVPNDILREKLRALPTRLRKVIVGQDNAVAIVAERLLHGELGLTGKCRLKAGFLFLGPTGVGKTELTIQFTHELFGAGKLVRIDMSEYQTRESLALLLGTSRGDPGRIAEGFDECGGAGTILFDEIEKAHPLVLDVLLQLFDAARLTAGGNRLLDFSSWYAVATSNIGAQRMMSLRKSKYETMERLVRQDAQRELRPELFARVTTVVFARLDYGIQCQVAQVLIEKELSQQRERGHGLICNDGVLDVVIKRGYDERLGARPMRDAAEMLIRSALAHDLLKGGGGAGELTADTCGLKLQLKAREPTERS